MPSLPSRALVLLGIISLAHAYSSIAQAHSSQLISLSSCYSAYEHSSLISHLKPSASTSTSSALPLDITLETIVSTALICLGLVMGTEELQPIEWRVWAGKVERERKGGPYGGLEERMGFVDIRVCGEFVLAL